MSNDLGLFSFNWQYLSTLGPSGQSVTGPLKAAQRYAAAFLTEQGSVQYNPDYGTEFLYYLRFSMIRTDFDVAVYFNQASTQALDYIDKLETIDNPFPDDEAITAVDLDHFELAPPNLLLYVTITMRSGDTVQITLPATAAAGEVTDAN